MPVEKRTLLFRTEVWNARTRTFELVRVLADSASEAQMCTQDYLCERSPANIRITGVNSSSTRSSAGFVYIRIGSPEQTRLVRLPATTTDSISGGATQVLLHAGTCKRLGLFLDYDIHSSDSPLLSLPQLPRGSDEHWIQQHEVASGVGDTHVSLLLRQPASRPLRKSRRTSPSRTPTLGRSWRTALGTLSQRWLTRWTTFAGASRRRRTRSRARAWLDCLLAAYSRSSKHAP